MDTHTADRLAIADVVNRYFMAIDSRDWDRLRSCFTPDVEGIYEGVRVAGGIEQIMAFFTGRSPVRFPLEIVDLRASMHFIGNHYAEVTGDRAVAQTYAQAHLIDRPATGPRMRTRGLRYLDELVRVDGRWLISRREHVLDWMRRDELLVAPAAAD
ncbi:nuclear transport factor 2 family protein [Solwaraspora sp. WMMD791]|uniref:nuclear transport factor 2 family protein n=1 Tax=Solwaraspora sp. WMMD791 TaxID=3016086 RepID=UPI00249C0EE2|nr:nuclear transport factor 2 family protein [Solwaraspora sp. WMMD791]WFE28097.1 nuclear transport factor 2 family protein [Solwaraspora sp. WMMD791]